MTKFKVFWVFTDGKTDTSYHEAASWQDINAMVETWVRGSVKPVASTTTEQV